MRYLSQNHLKTRNLMQMVDTFEEAVMIVKKFALLETHKQSEQKRLYYHNCNHAFAVQRRANIILLAIEPFVDIDSSQSLTRLKHLIDICALSHDMMQIFFPNTKINLPRKRKPGISEAATISQIVKYIENLNTQLVKLAKDQHITFTKSDIRVIQESIKATICLHDLDDNSIYQPYLYASDHEISLPARIIALADIGSLGIEGIEVCIYEGGLLFLEENPDIIPIIFNQEYLKNSKIAEQLRQRLLQRARFQVDFAKGREARFMQEVHGLPDDAIHVLKNKVFKFLNKTNIRKIESITPTSDEATVEELIEFFDLKNLVASILN